MCRRFGGYSPIIFFHFFFFFFFFFFALFQLSFFFSCDTMPWVACGRNSSHSLIPNLVFLSRTDDVDVLLGLSSHHFYQLFPLFRSYSGPSSIRIDTLCAQLILQFFTHHFKTMYTCSIWSEDVRMVLGFCHYFFIIFFCFHFFGLVFRGPISIGIDTLWAQLFLEFSTNHFETMHIFSTWSENVYVVLGIYSYSTDLKLTTLY